MAALPLCDVAWIDRGGPLPLGTVTPSLQLARQSLLVGVLGLEFEASLRDRVAPWSSVKKTEQTGGVERESAEHSVSTAGQKSPRQAQ